MDPVDGLADGRAASDSRRASVSSDDAALSVARTEGRASPAPSPGRSLVRNQLGLIVFDRSPGSPVAHVEPHDVAMRERLLRGGAAAARARQPCAN
jgi:hypothetical protein